MKLLRIMILALFACVSATLAQRAPMGSSYSPFSSRTTGTYSAGNVSYSYDANGNLVTGRKSGNTTEYFNSAGRIAVDRTYGNATYRTDGHGLINSVTYGKNLQSMRISTPKVGVTDLLVGNVNAPSAFSVGFASGGLFPSLAPLSSGRLSRPMFGNGSSVFKLNTFSPGTFGNFTGY